MSKLGAGGMGEVYLAKDTRLDRKVALKILPEQFTKDESRLRRFVQEAKAASALNHPNIITIYEIGEASSEFGGTHYIATEYVDGQTLRRQMTVSRLPLNAVLDIAAQVASALAAAHDAGITHRDIKPENVMVRRDGIVKVLDFGLAKLTERHAPSEVDEEAPTLAKVTTAEGTVVGTPQYMSPEQARGQRVDARTDIFSLGVLLYEMIAGCRPFEGVNAIEVLGAILHREPPPLAQRVPDTPKELQRIVAKALRKDREERYQVVKDLLLDLKSLRQGIEFSTKLERVSSYFPSDSETAAARTESVHADMTGRVEPHSTMMSASYLAAQLKQHKRLASVTLATAIVAAAAWFFYSHRQLALTEDDTVLLADFVNTTGEEVFDGALKQALAVELEQTPFLKLFTEERVRETLRMMNRAPEARVTREMAREICQRRGLKAAIIGSIAKFERRYAITLETIEGRSGETFARAVREAEGKDRVLGALGQTATELRAKLGESLASIRTFDAPLEQATTSSLEALKAYSLGEAQRRQGNPMAAVPPFQRALELDPDFALTHAAIGTAYSSLDQPELAAEHAEKAYELRERTSGRERLLIATVYHGSVTGQLGMRFQVLQLWTQTYPRDARPHSFMAAQHNAMGQFSQAEAEAREAIRLEPDVASVYYVPLASSLIRRNLFDQAKEAIGEALTRNFDNPGYHTRLYQIGFVQGDRALMREQLEGMSGKPNEYQALELQAQTAAFAGRMRESSNFARRAREMAIERRLSEAAGEEASQAALRQALVGVVERSDLAQAATPPSSFRRGLREGLPFLVWPLALALSGEIAQAQQLTEEVARRNPDNLLLQAVWLPASRAAIELQRGQPGKVLDLLQSSSQYDAGAQCWPTYLRGTAYLRLGRGTEAAAEFQKIIEHRGWDPISMLWPLAHLGLARAEALKGDMAASRKAYQDFLMLWQQADEELPVLAAARKEYAKLK